MALSTLHKLKVRTLFGIPNDTDGYVVAPLTSLYGPGAESYDFTAIVTEFTDRWDTQKVDSDFETMLTDSTTGLLTRLDQIGYVNPMEIDRSAGGDEGVIVNYTREREQIRQTIATMMGFYVPSGGFVRENKSEGGRVIR